METSQPAKNQNRIQYTVNKGTGNNQGKAGFADKKHNGKQGEKRKKTDSVRKYKTREGKKIKNQGKEKQENGISYRLKSKIPGTFMNQCQRCPRLPFSSLFRA